MDRLSPEEKEWRLSLKEGSKLDAVKIEKEYTLKQWSKGVIVNMSEKFNFFGVEFENENSSKTFRDFTLYSPEIARYDTKSKGDAWRLLLKPGDIVDAYDTTKVWYSSTVLEKEVREMEEGE